MKEYIREKIRGFRRKFWLYGLWMRLKQRDFLRRHPPGHDAVIVFLVAGWDDVNGGIMAIIRHAEASADMFDPGRTRVYVCTMPGHAPILRFTRFKNNTTIVPFEMLLGVLAPGVFAHINIPEIYLQEFNERGLSSLAGRKKASTGFNIMLQNIDFAPERSAVALLQQHGEVTATTAHKAYALKGEKILGCRTWHWSVWVSPEKYEYRPYTAKENIIVVSPDVHPQRERILAALRKGNPDYQIIRIWGITHEEYAALIGRAKYSLTFGEGLDGYFVEPIFSGSVGLAVYNARFFTEEYRNLAGVFNSWDEVELKLPAMIRTMSQDSYEEIRRAQFATVAGNYAYSEYVQNLKKYYASVSTAWSKTGRNP